MGGLGDRGNLFSGDQITGDDGVEAGCIVGRVVVPSEDKVAFFYRHVCRGQALFIYLGGVSSNCAELRSCLKERRRHSDVIVAHGSWHTRSRVIIYLDPMSRRAPPIVAIASSDLFFSEDTARAVSLHRVDRVHHGYDSGSSQEIFTKCAKDLQVC